MNNDKLTFEEAVKALEETVKIMENGDLGLDDLLEQYEKGIHLLRCCEAKLVEAEGKIEVLSQKEKDAPQDASAAAKSKKAAVFEAAAEDDEIPLPDKSLFDKDSLF